MVMHPIYTDVIPFIRKARGTKINKFNNHGYHSIGFSLTSLTSETRESVNRLNFTRRGEFQLRVLKLVHFNIIYVDLYLSCQ